MAKQQEQQSAVTTVAPPESVEAEEFAQVLKGNFKPRTERAATEVENAIQTLVTQALADSCLVKDEVLDTIEEMIARLDEKLSAQMNEVLHAPEFQNTVLSWTSESALPRPAGRIAMPSYASANSTIMDCRLWSGHPASGFWAR